jgi:uncharacterized membrane protein
MFEARHRKLLSAKLYIKRVIKSLVTGMLIIFASLIIGMIGYRYSEDMSWMDSYMNAAMILSGMGPVTELHTSAGKLFAGSYALFSGIIFLVVIAVILAPIFHRFLHKFHLQDKRE